MGRGRWFCVWRLSVTWYVNIHLDGCPAVSFCFSLSPHEILYFTTHRFTSSEVRGQRLKVRGQRSRSEVRVRGRCQRPEARGQRSEVNDQVARRRLVALGQRSGQESEAA